MKKNLLTLVLLAAPLFAQDTLKDALVKHWKTTTDFTLAVAQAMPAESYNFRPNPEEMSFGELMVHIGAADIGACAIASGMARPAMSPAIAAAVKDEKSDVPKDQAIPFLRESLDFCNKAVASMTPEKLHAVVGPATRKMSGFEWLWAYFTHTAHHRGQAEVYLRMKGIKPPDYAF